MKTPSRHNDRLINLTAAFILFSGAALRLIHYFANRSLWLDEAWIAIYVSFLSFQQILGNIRFALDMPVPPMGFLLAQKGAITLLGNHEMALRLYSLVCGLAALGMFFVMARKIMSRSWALLALTLFAFSPVLVYYSAEAKQYSGDVFLTLAVFLAAMAIGRRRFRQGEVFLLAVLGVVCMIFSHGILFVLGAAAAYLLVSRLALDDRQGMLKLVPVFMIWALSFGYWYRVSFQGMLTNPTIAKGAGRFFMPWPVWSVEAILWLFRTPIEMFRETAGLAPVALAAGLFVLGMAHIYRRDKKILILLLGPLFLALFAGALHKYTIHGRFLLFMSPAICIGVAVGVHGLVDRLPAGIRAPAAGLLAAALLVYPVVFNTTYSDPKTREQMRPIVRVMARHVHPKDRVLVNSSGSFAFTYYMLYDGNRKDFPSQIRLFSDSAIRSGERPYVKMLDRSFFKNDLPVRWSDSAIKRAYSPEELVGADLARTWIILSHQGDAKEFLRPVLSDEDVGFQYHVDETSIYLVTPQKGE